MNWLDSDLTISFLISLENFMALKVFQFFSQIKSRILSKISSTKGLHCFILTISHSCQVPNHKCFNFSKQLFNFANKGKLKLAPEFFFKLLLVINLGYENGFSAIKPTLLKVPAIHRIRLSTTKNELMRCIGSMNFHSKLFSELRLNMMLLYTFLKIFSNSTGF